MGTESTLLDLILEPGRLSVVFQPIFTVKARTAKLHGVECLTRGPRGSNVECPAVLFEYARRRHAEAAVDRACITSALAVAGELPEAPRLSLNVHASTLGRDPTFPAFFLSCAEAAGIEPDRLVLEVVEHAPPLDDRRFHRALEELREANVAIALDDVGLGESNFKMILDVRPDVYKLDRYLVTGAAHDPYRQVILESLAGMARLLGAHSVAEGVESPHELLAVQSAGIELVQGFLFARPMPSDELVSTGFLSGRTHSWVRSEPDLSARGAAAGASCPRGGRPEWVGPLRVQGERIVD